jgi:hypothetical protein
VWNYAQEREKIPCVTKDKNVKVIVCECNCTEFNGKSFHTASELLPNPPTRVEVKVEKEENL